MSLTTMLYDSNTNTDWGNKTWIENVISTMLIVSVLEYHTAFLSCEYSDICVGNA